MRFSIAAVLAFAASALAVDPTEGFNVITKPIKGEEVPAGSTYEIVWQPNAANHPGAVTIGLLGGATPGTLDVVATIAKGVDPSTGSYSWSVPTDATLATYGIVITLESDKDVYQFGFPFKIVGGSKGGSSSSTSATGSASNSASTTGTGSASASTTASGTGSRSVTSTVSSSAVSSTIVSTTARSNLTTTSGGQQTTITTVVSSKPSTTKSSTTSIATNGVATMAAGGFAMLGGVAMAVLAL